MGSWSRRLAPCSTFTGEQVMNYLKILIKNHWHEWFLVGAGTYLIVYVLDGIVGIW